MQPMRRLFWGQDGMCLLYGNVKSAITPPYLKSSVASYIVDCRLGDLCDKRRSQPARDIICSFAEALARKMSVPLCCLRLAMAEQRAGDRQALSAHHRP